MLTFHVIITSCLLNQAAKTNLFGSFRINFTGLKFPEQLHWGLHIAARCFLNELIGLFRGGSLLYLHNIHKLYKLALRHEDPYMGARQLWL